MKSKSLLLTAIMAIIVMSSASAQTWSCGYPNAADVTATLGSDGTLTISGTGAMADYICSSCMPWNSANSQITQVVIEDGVTSIGNEVFAYCTKLTSVTISNSVTSIGDYAFYNCINLKSVIIPSSVTSIGGYAFHSSGLTSVIIGSGITSIGSNTFFNLPLASITCLNPNPATITLSDYTFNKVDTAKCVLIVPSGSVDLYKNASQWKNFSTITGENFSLTNLTVSAGSLSPAFDSYTFTYRDVVPQNVGNIVLTATPIADATVSGDGQKTLNFGDNTFNITVTGSQGSFVYTVIVTRTLDTYLLTDLSVSAGTLSPAFSPNLFDYQVTVPYSIKNITLTATPIIGASVSGDGQKALNTGKNTFDITVVSPTLGSFVYTVVVIRTSTHYVKVDGTGDGSSWANAAGNIQDVIDNAVPGDEVWIAAGTYYPTVKTDSTNELSKKFKMKDGVNLYGGFAGNETSIDSRVQSDNDGNGKIDAWEFANKTVLSGQLSDSTNSSTVVSMSGFTIETHFDGFTVSNGSTGIDASGTTVINNCIVRDNNKYGGGISNGTGTVSNCKITNNRSYMVVTSNITSTCVTIGGSSFCFPTWYRNYAGGIYNGGGTIANCVVTNNTCEVNSATGVNVEAQGGGIYNNKGTIINCIVTGNSCSATGSGTRNAQGGGIYNNYGIVANCCVANNTLPSGSSKSGGGIYNYGSSSSGMAYVYCSTIVNNSTSNIKTYNDSTDFFYNCIVDETDMTQFLNANMNDYHLQAGSKYIDAGSLDNLPAWLTGGTDLAGKPRTHDGKISVGAYEYDWSLTGMKETPLSKTVVFPNPAIDEITVSGLQSGETISVYNISGQQMFMRKATGETEQFAVGHLPAGIYFVKISSGQTLKWIKK